MCRLAGLAIRGAGAVWVLLTLPLIVGQTEHKVMAHMQGRLGPMYAGAFHGWAQLIADGVKFVQKESITPRSADAPVFRLAPFVALLPYLVILLVIPLGPGGLVAQPLGRGLLLVLAVAGLGVVSVLMASWARRTSTPCSAGCGRPPRVCLGDEMPFVLAAASAGDGRGHADRVGSPPTPPSPPPHRPAHLSGGLAAVVAAVACMPAMVVFSHGQAAAWARIRPSR